MFPFLLRTLGGNYRIQKKELHFKKFSEVLSQYSTHVIFFFVTIIIPSGYLASLNKIDSDTLEMFREDTQVRKSYDFSLKHIGGIKGVELILKDKDVLTLENLNKIKELEKRLLKLPYITKVLNLRSYILQAMKLFDLKESQMTNDYIQDAKTFLELNSSSERGLYKWINFDQTQMRISVLWTLSSSQQSIVGINQIKKIAKDIGLNLYVTGKTSMIVGANRYMVQTFFKSIFFAIVLLFLFMAISFKSFTLGIFSMVPNVVPLILVGGIAYLLGISINMGTVLVASVCLGIAIDDTIHFLNAFHNRKTIEETMIEKVTYILEHIGSALINTTLILVVCFSMFLFGNIEINAEFGMLTELFLLLHLFVISFYYQL